MSSSRKQNEAPARLQKLEARALRGNVHVKDVLREGIRREVTRDGTMRDVHRIRNAGLSFFREADSKRLPKTVEDPVPKVRQQAVNKLVLVSSLELQKQFQEREDRWFQHLVSSSRLPPTTSSPVPSEGDDFDDCEVCRREQEAAACAAQQGDFEEEHFDEQQACAGQEECERPAGALVEKDNGVAIPIVERHRGSSLMHTKDDYESFEDAPSVEARERSSWVHTKDDYDSFESKEDIPSMEARAKSALRHTKDDYESFENTGETFEASAVGRDATWVPGRRKDSSHTPTPALGAPLPVATRASVIDGHPRHGSGLRREDSILAQESERELLKEHLLCVLNDRRSATPGEGRELAAAANSSAEPDYDDEAFEEGSQSEPFSDAER